MCCAGSPPSCGPLGCTPICSPPLVCGGACAAPSPGESLLCCPRGCLVASCQPLCNHQCASCPPGCVQACPCSPACCIPVTCQTMACEAPSCPTCFCVPALFCIPACC